MRKDQTVELHGKVAIVTGGSVRLGKAIALCLAEEGVKIGLHYNQSARQAEGTLEDITSLGSTGMLIQADFRQPLQAAETIVEKTLSEFHRVDILINSAAIFEESVFSSVTEDHWDRHFDVNLKAPFFLCQKFAQHLEHGERAQIVNISDWRGTRPGNDHPVYTLTKSALVAMTKSLALHLAPDVQVNAIAPGAILPPQGSDQNYLQQAAERIPLRQTGTPQDVTKALLYLLRSDFITGEVLHVTGGQQL
jgi:NAD(P)-dependent dehydrogenase (short-subunit alcohol dehydrogenase family)